jgi:membrane-bound ClpP family serine protease
VVNHTQRFRLGVILVVLGLILTFVEGWSWVKHGGLPYGLLTLLGIAMLAYGVTLLRHKRSV